MVTFFRKLDAETRLQAQMVGDPAAADRFNIMASHPRTSDRLQNVTGLTASAGNAEARTNQEEYLRAIDGMIFGDAPEDGIRRGRDFQHPGLGIAFRVPPGFVMQNSAREVTAIGPQRSLIVFDRARADETPAAGTMEQYLTRVWAARASLRDVEPFTVNGMDAATATTRVSTRQGRMDARLVAIRAPESIYRFLFLTPPELSEKLAPAFKETGYSFRRLSADEIAAIRPLRVRVVTVAANDGVDALAAAMPYGSYNDAMFRVLNGLNAGSTPAPGQLVKTVRE
jgi:predicted Zn-dependent protease